MIPADSRVFTSQVMLPPRAAHIVTSDYSEGKWPVWLRLLTIIGLSAGLWAVIIWTAVSIFG